MLPDLFLFLIRRWYIRSVNPPFSSKSRDSLASCRSRRLQATAISTSAALARIAASAEEFVDRLDNVDGVDSVDGVDRGDETDCLDRQTRFGKDSSRSYPPLQTPGKSRRPVTLNTGGVSGLSPGRSRTEGTGEPWVEGGTNPSQPWSLGSFSGRFSKNSLGKYWIRRKRRYQGISR